MHESNDPIPKDTKLSPECKDEPVPACTSELVKLEPAIRTFDNRSPDSPAPPELTTPPIGCDSDPAMDDVPTSPTIPDPTSVPPSDSAFEAVIADDPVVPKLVTFPVGFDKDPALDNVPKAPIIPGPSVDMVFDSEEVKVPADNASVKTLAIPPVECDPAVDDAPTDSKLVSVSTSNSTFEAVTADDPVVPKPVTFSVGFEYCPALDDVPKAPKILELTLDMVTESEEDVIPAGDPSVTRLATSVVSNPARDEVLVDSTDSKPTVVSVFDPDEDKVPTEPKPPVECVGYGTADNMDDVSTVSEPAVEPASDCDVDKCPDSAVPRAVTSPDPALDDVLSVPSDSKTPNCPVFDSEEEFTIALGFSVDNDPKPAMDDVFTGPTVSKPPDVRVSDPEPDKDPIPPVDDVITDTIVSGPSVVPASVSAVDEVPTDDPVDPKLATPPADCESDPAVDDVLTSSRVVELPVDSEIGINVGIDPSNDPTVSKLPALPEDSDDSTFPRSVPTDSDIDPIEANGPANSC